MTPTTLLFVLAAAFPAQQSTTAAGGEEARLDATTFDGWLAYLRPAPEELAWREIAWLDSFGKAVIEAQREERPILLWAMNGHPLGCT